MSTTPITQLAQQPSTDALITLYELDARALGDTDIRRFCDSAVADANGITTGLVTFGSLIYTPLQMEADGFEWNGQGQAPIPKIRFANANSVIEALARDYGELVGASVSRIRTFRRYLDDGIDPDPAMRFTPDIFRVERKSSHTAEMIEFELAVPMDQEGRKIPGRQVLRDTCTHIYRRWNQVSGTFDYSEATCPYAAATYFKANGDSTATASEDRCGRQITDCAKRFPNQPLPTRAFPGVSRMRQ